MTHANVFFMFKGEGTKAPVTICSTNLKVSKENCFKTHQSYYFSELNTSS